jgi:hypothetical protein
MATMLMEPAIKTAMNKMGLEERAEELLDILDKIELDRNLAISMEQADRGETMSLDELKKRMDEKFANGYFTKENARKRIEEKYANRR